LDIFHSPSCVPVIVAELILSMTWLLSIWSCPVYTNVSKSFRTESITKCIRTTISTRWEATERVMAAKLTRLTHGIAIQLYLVAENCTICSSRSRRPVLELLDTPSYFRCKLMCLFITGVCTLCLQGPPGTRCVEKSIWKFSFVQVCSWVRLHELRFWVIWFRLVTCGWFHKTRGISRLYECH